MIELSIAKIEIDAQMIFTNNVCLIFLTIDIIIKHSAPIKLMSWNITDPELNTLKLTRK